MNHRDKIDSYGFVIGIIFGSIITFLLMIVNFDRDSGQYMLAQKACQEKASGSHAVSFDSSEVVCLNGVSINYKEKQ